MKYVIFKKDTNTVVGIRDKEPIAVSDRLGVARCEYIPQGTKHIALNIQEKQEEYIEKVTEKVMLATGEEKEIIKAITKTRTYLTCDLIAL